MGRKRKPHLSLRWASRNLQGRSSRYNWCWGTRSEQQLTPFPHIRQFLTNTLSRHAYRNPLSRPRNDSPPLRTKIDTLFLNPTQPPPLHRNPLNMHDHLPHSPPNSHNDQPHLHPRTRHHASRRPTNQHRARRHSRRRSSRPGIEERNNQGLRQRCVLRRACRRAK